MQITIGVVVGFIVFGCLCAGFEAVVGKTPLNLLGIGGALALKNAMINLLLFSILTLAITSIPALFVKNKILWLESVTTGMLVALLLASLAITMFL